MGKRLTLVSNGTKTLRQAIPRTSTLGCGGHVRAFKLARGARGTCVAYTAVVALKIAGQAVIAASKEGTLDLK